MQDLIKRDLADSVEPIKGDIVYIKSLKMRGVVVSLHAEPNGMMYKVKYDDEPLYLYCWRSGIVRVPQ